MVCYCVTAVVSIHRFGALTGSILAFAAWAAVAAASYTAVLAH